jgi:hypothetical protein
MGWLRRLGWSECNCEAVGEYLLEQLPAGLDAPDRQEVSDR